MLNARKASKYIRSDSTSNYTSFEIVLKQRNWVSYELKPRDIERRSCPCDIMVARQKGRPMKNGYITITLKRENHGDHLVLLQSQQPNWIFMKKNDLYLVGSAWYRVGTMSCWNRARKLLELFYRTQLRKLNRELKDKRVHYYCRYNKFFLLHEHARPYVAILVNTFENT